MPPVRREFVFHIYVDPLFGDDARASTLNPQPNATPPALRPLSVHFDPGDAVDPHPIAGVLQHAPYPFQTLTGQNGALAYARNFLPNPLTVPPQVFWTNTFSFDGQPQPVVFTVRQVVIHCLPGLYGPFGGALPRIDPVSGIPYNGEVWPVALPSFVSLQGTSALDTIFDARFVPGLIISAAALASEVPLGSISAHEESFVDSVSFRNARGGPPGAFGTGAAIYIWPGGGGVENNLASRLFVTNCVFVNNDVGVGVDSYHPLLGDVTQRPRFVNNTFAWNGIGLWSGNTRSVTPTSSDNDLLVVNNIFDSGSPPGYRTGLSGFEGVSPPEREIQRRGLPPNEIVFAPVIDTNAWQLGFTNIQVTLTNWPPTLPRTTGGVGPVEDLVPYVGAGGGAVRPGCLYINDIFRAAFGGTDYSPHDFRLAPLVTVNSTVPPTTLNPLVNRGVGPIPSISSFPIFLVSGASLPFPPGLPPGSEGRAGPGTIPTSVDGWDYDSEGFGNRRNEPRAGFPANPVNNLGEMDVGADEMGLLILAGFFNGTRILTPDPIPNAPAAPPHGGIYFFDLPAPAPGWQRPATNIYAAGFPYWYDHVQLRPDAEAGNYTNGLNLGSRNPALGPPERWWLTQFGWKPYLCGMECDFSPHLVPDLHPFWGAILYDPLSNLAGDLYASNPWYDDPAAAPSYPFVTRNRFDNPTLFHNFGGTLSTSWAGLLALVPMYVRDATLNSPGSYALPTRWTLDPVVQFGPYTPCGGSSATTYNVGVWGFGDAPASCPDQVPGVATGGGTLLVSALRFNCEQLPTPNGQFPTGSNLQTFLGIRTPPPVIGAGAQETGRRSAGSIVVPTVIPDRSYLRTAVRRAMERQ